MMKSSIEQISRIILVVGFITLSIAVLVAAVIPNVLHVYLIANPSSFEHSVLSPDIDPAYYHKNHRKECYRPTPPLNKNQ